LKCPITIQIRSVSNSTSTTAVDRRHPPGLFGSQKNTSAKTYTTVSLLASSLLLASHDGAYFTTTRLVSLYRLFIMPDESLNKEIPVTGMAGLAVYTATMGIPGMTGVAGSLLLSLLLQL